MNKLNQFGIKATRKAVVCEINSNFLKVKDEKNEIHTFIRGSMNGVNHNDFKVDDEVKIQYIRFASGALWFIKKK